MKFNIFAGKKEKPLTGYALGRHGNPEEIFNFARTAGDWHSKTDLLNGTMDAYLAGEAENLRQFFTGYLDLKRANGNISSDIDEGFLNLFADPMMRLMERSLDPQKTFEELSEKWSAFYRQIALDFTLRRACSSNSDTVAECLIKMGADINAHNGRLLFIAVKNRADRVTRILIARGALPDSEVFGHWKAADQDYYDRIKSQLAKTPKAASTEPTLPSIAHNKRLTGDPAKDFTP